MKRTLLFITVALMLIAGARAQTQALQPWKLWGNVWAAAFGRWQVASLTQVPSAGTYVLSLSTAAPPVLPGGQQFQPLATNAPILVDPGPNQETVTPTAVNCSWGQGYCTVTVTLTKAHNYNFGVRSGTDGLQEAINYEHGAGGTVHVDSTWSGTTSEITGASGYTNVEILDERTGATAWYGWTGSAYEVAFGLNNPPGSLSLTCSGCNFTGTSTFSGPVVASDGGTLSGTFGGSPTIASPTISGGTLSGSITDTATHSAPTITSLTATSPAITPTSIEGVEYADQFAGADIGAKINAAIVALPSCAVGTDIWNHCGTVYIPASSAAYAMTTSVDQSSALVWIHGAGNTATVLNYTGSACAFDFTTSPVSTASELSPEISNLSIDGTGAGASACGIRGANLPEFSIQNITVRNFTGADAAGIVMLSNSVPTGAFGSDERWQINAAVYNDTVGWLIEDDVPSVTPGYEATFGYGQVYLRANVYGGQTGVKMLNGPDATDTSPVVTYDNLHLIVNGDGGSNETGTDLEDGAWIANVYNAHMEGVTTALKTGSGVAVTGGGSWDSGTIADALGTNSYKAVISSSDNRISGSSVLMLGDPNGCGFGVLVNVCSDNPSIIPLAIGEGGDDFVQFDNSGNVNFSAQNFVGEAVRWTSSGLADLSISRGGAGQLDVNGSTVGDKLGAINAASAVLSGAIQWGGGAAIASSNDVALLAGAAFTGTVSAPTLEEGGAGVAVLTGASFTGGISAPTVTNSCSGVSAAMAAGTVTVSASCITGSRPISLVEATKGGTQGFLSYTETSGSLVITSSSSTDTSTVSWVQN